LRQILRNPDKRYDNFFSSIFTAEAKLPDQIKVISWNYDFQIERSYLEFNKTVEINSCRSALGMTSPYNWADQSMYAKKFNVIKLNGSARIKTIDFEGYLFSNSTGDRDSDAEETIDRYLTITQGREPIECELKFAWESKNYNTLFNAIESELSKITVLVIIGYSFPFFNREVDRMLFKLMGNLQKIYIQDINPSDIKESMEEFVNNYNSSGSNIEYFYKTNLKQFVFPKELDVRS